MTDVSDVIDVVLPCLDEAGALPWVLDRMPEGYRAIVVDNGSRDGSAAVARAHGAQVVHEPRPGFGAACHAGLIAARGAVVCVMDADASLDPRELPTVTDPVLDGAANLVLGRRMPTGRGAWPWHGRAANRLLAARLRRRTRYPLHDLGPMRAARRASLLALGLTDRRFGYPLEMVLRAAAAGWSLTEVPVTYHPRVGASKVTGTARGTARAIKDMRRVLAEVPPAGAAPAGAGGAGERS